MMFTRQVDYQWVLFVLTGFALGLGVLLARPVFADDKDKVIGTWKLVSVVYEDVQTKERTPYSVSTRRVVRSLPPRGGGLHW